MKEQTVLVAVTLVCLVSLLWGIALGRWTAVSDSVADECSRDGYTIERMDLIPYGYTIERMDLIPYGKCLCNEDPSCYCYPI